VNAGHKPSVVPTGSQPLHKAIDKRAILAVVGLIAVVGIGWRGMWVLQHPDLPIKRTANATVAPGNDGPTNETGPDGGTSSVDLPAPSTQYIETANSEMVAKLIDQAEPSVRELLRKAESEFQKPGQELETQKLYEQVIVKWSLDKDREHDGEYLVQQRLGRIYNSEGNLTSAVQACNRAVELTKKRFGPESPQLAIALVWLGYVCGELNDFDTAADAMKAALVIRQKLGNVDKQTLGDNAMRIGIVSYYGGNMKESKKYLTLARNIWKNDGVAEGVMPSRALSDLGSIYLKEGDYAQAKAILKEGNRMFKHLGLIDSAYGRKNVAWLKEARQKLPDKKGQTPDDQI